MLQVKVENYRRKTNQLSFCSFIDSEYGVWRITFYHGTAWKDKTGTNCDPLQAANCDPYIKILIDDQEVFRTKTHWHQNVVNFDETFVSARMRKNASIAIEMWDDDSTVGDWGTPDDLMARWRNGNVEVFSSHSKLAGPKWYGKYQNKVRYSSSWTDELSDDSK